MSRTFSRELITIELKANYIDPLVEIIQVCSIPWEFRTLAFLVVQLANFTN